MAHVADLLRTLSRYDGRPLATFQLIARELRNAGLLSARTEMVSPTEAANLLLASIGTESPRQTPRAVQVLRSLRRSPGEGVGKTLPALVGPARCGSFGSAIEELLRASLRIKAELEALLRLLHPEVESGLLDLGTVRVEISVTRPSPSARLALVSVDDYEGQLRTEFASEWSLDPNLLKEGFYGPEQNAGALDKKVGTTVSQKTLFALGDALCSGREDGRVAKFK